MNELQTWGEITAISLFGLWEKFINFFPILLGAILVFLLGWIIAVVMEKVVEKMILSLRIDQAFEKMGLRKKLNESGINLNIAAFFGGLVKWFLILVFLKVKFSNADEKIKISLIKHGIWQIQ